MSALRNHSLIEGIEKRLDRLSQRIKSFSRNGLNDSAKYLEPFAARLLNLIYEWRLRDPAPGVANTKAVDLIDDTKKVAVQVSVQESSSKITHTKAMLRDGKLDGYTIVVFFLHHRNYANHQGLRVINISTVIGDLMSRPVSFLNQVTALLDEELSDSMAASDMSAPILGAPWSSSAACRPLADFFHTGGSTEDGQPSCADAGTPTRKNPFKTGGALPHDHPTYIRRQADNDFETLLAGPERLIAIVGEFGIGKSSLMQQARRLLSEHAFFGGGLAGLRSDDAGLFMKNFFRLFTNQFGLVTEWDHLDELTRQSPSILFLDDLGEVLAPGLEAFIPTLVERLTQPGAGLRVIATAPMKVAGIFSKRGLDQPRYARPWKHVQVAPCRLSEWRTLLELLRPRARDVATDRIAAIESNSRMSPKRLQCLCHRLFEGETDGWEDARLAALVEMDESYE